MFASINEVESNFHVAETRNVQVWFLRKYIYVYMFIQIWWSELAFGNVGVNSVVSYSDLQIED